MQVLSIDRSGYFDEARRAEIEELLAQFEQDCIDLGLGASVATVQKIRQSLLNPPIAHRRWWQRKKGYDYRTLADLSRELHGRLTDEMQSRFFWALTPQEHDHYANPRKGWELIIDRFANTVGDIEEAQKCFALSRYGAAVFHSLQVVESGLIELGTVIRVADPKSGWTAVSNQLKKIVSKKYEDRTDFEKEHFDFLEQMQGTVEALKNAWRNKVSHAYGKLRVITESCGSDAHMKKAAYPSA